MKVDGFRKEKEGDNIGEGKGKGKRGLNRVQGVCLRVEESRGGCKIKERVKDFEGAQIGWIMEN